MSGSDRRRGSVISIERSARRTASRARSAGLLMALRTARALRPAASLSASAGHGVSVAPSRRAQTGHRVGGVELAPGGAQGLDLEEPAQRHARPERADAEADEERARPSARSRAPTSLLVSMRRGRGRAISLPRRAAAPPRASRRAPQSRPFEHERAAHEPVRRADELHHLDLATAREDREADRVRDQDHRRDQEHDDHDEEDDPIRLPTWMIRFDVCWPSFTVSTPLNFCARRSRGDRLHVLGALRRDLERRRQAGSRAGLPSAAGTSSASA